MKLRTTSTQFRGVGCIQRFSCHWVRKRGTTIEDDFGGICATWNHFMFFYGWRANLNFKSIRCEEITVFFSLVTMRGRLCRTTNQSVKRMKINAESSEHKGGNLRRCTYATDQNQRFPFLQKKKKLCSMRCNVAHTDIVNGYAGVAEMLHSYRCAVLSSFDSTGSCNLIKIKFILHGIS